MDELEKPRVYRERKTFSKKDKYVEKELSHPIHAPYKRPTKDVMKHLVEEEESEQA